MSWWSKNRPECKVVYLGFSQDMEEFEFQGRRSPKWVLLCSTSYVCWRMESRSGEKWNISGRSPWPKGLWSHRKVPPGLDTNTGPASTYRGTTRSCWPFLSDILSVHIAQMCHAAPLGLPVTSQGPSQLAPGWVLPSTRTSFLGALQELLSILESSLLTSLFNNHEMCLGHCALLLNNII